MDEKEKSAYHEAGHCFRAWSIYSPAVRSVCLSQEGEEWSGETNIKKSWFPERGFISVALTGMLAEAKAVASEHGAVQQVDSSPNLVETILGIIVNHLPNPGGDPWEVAVPIVGHGPQNANITREDLELIPVADRTEERLTTALNDNCHFLNDAVHWHVVSEVAQELDRLAPKCFKQFRIYCIIREATQDALTEEDPA